MDETRSAPAGKRRNGLVGQVVEATIERIVPGGWGLAHAVGRTLFVGLAAPGDRLRVRIERERGAVCFGTTVEVLEPAPQRVPAPCPYYGTCGGCDFQHLTAAAQLAAKVGIIRDCLHRIGGIEPPVEIPITPSPNVWAYRARAEWQHVARQRLLGYFARESHRVCDVVACMVLVPPLEQTLGHLRVRMAAGELPPAVREFRAVAGDQRVGLAPPLDPAQAGELVCAIAGETYRFDADCFFQVNHVLLAPLVAEALRFATPQAADDTESGLAVDLYCGVGLFTLPLTRRFHRVIGVEAHRHAARFAVRNLRDAGLNNARVEAVPVEHWLIHRAAALAPAAFALLDPPRTGAGAEVVSGLLTLAPRRLAYVSCDPATLARDLRQLLAGGYELAGLAAFDLFPQTHHVETVAHLVRAA